VELVVAWKELLMAAGSGWQDLLFSVLHGVGHGLMVVAMESGGVLVLSALYHFFDLILELECHIRCAVCVLHMFILKNKGVFD
jgi:hypothetical protein